MRPGPMDWDYEEFARRGELWTAGEPPAGVLVLRGGDAHLWVEVVAVEPSAQGSGLGGELMHFAEEEARRRGHGEVRLLTHELMHENRAFYEHLGYQEYELRREEGFSRVYLRKPLRG